MSEHGASRKSEKPAQPMSGTRSATRAPETAAVSREARVLFGGAARLFQSRWYHVGMETLCEGLRRLHTTCDRVEWQTVAAEARAHPVCGVVQQDPFTLRGCVKPRGYVGDAVTLDYAHSVDAPRLAPACRTAAGAAVFDFVTRGATASAIRRRSELAGRTIDRLVERRPNGRVLSIPCAHLRESIYSRAVRDGRVAEIVAIDADPDTVGQVSAEHSTHGVRAMRGTLADLLSDRFELGQFDLVLASGLLDHVGPDVACVMLETLFARVAPGGLLLVPAFLPTLRDLAYWDVFMDWHLGTRSTDELHRIARSLPDRPEQVAVLVEREHDLAWLALRRSGEAPGMWPDPLDEILG